MAHRVRRRHLSAQLNDNVLNNTTRQVQQRNSRYDMNNPQNWTVSQLRAELEQNNITFNKVDKKSKLIQLCRENGLFGKNSTSADDGHQNKEADLSILSKSVEELQKTVQILTGNIQKLMENAPATQHNTSVPNSDNGTTNTQVQPGLTNSMINSTGTSMNSGNSLLDLDTNSGIHNTLTPVDPVNNVLGGHTGVTPMNTLSSGHSGQPTRFGYSAESLPFVETIHPNIRKQITEGKDVNLASLLIPYYTGPHSDPSSASKEKPDPRLNNTLTLPQFIQAFGIYKNIMCEAYPSRRVELDMYERDVVDMATRYQGRGFYEYHKTFSAEAAAHLRYSNKKVDWSIRNNKLFTSIFVNHRANSCSLCYSSLHMTTFCPKHLEDKSTKSFNTNHQTTDVAGRSRIKFKGKEICNNFNSNSGCQYKACSRAHVCLTCKKDHSQISCDSKNSHTQTSSSKK